jgi:ZIP family zinc transporter
MTAILFAAATLLSTLGGGLFALRYRGWLYYILSFTAGVIIGVVSFDLLPEIYALAGSRGHDVTHAMIALVVGFMLFHALEKFVLLHHGHEAHYASHHHPEIGVLSALALAGHSYMDGVGIGLAFQVSGTAGMSVAIAVIAHDFCDGLNTVSLMLLNRNSTGRSVAMLVLDAVAPVLGAASTLAFHVPPYLLLLYLGFFAGFLLYIGASDILPEAHSQAAPRASLALIGLTALGAAFIFVVLQLAR